MSPGTLRMKSRRVPRLLIAATVAAWVAAVVAVLIVVIITRQPPMDPVPIP